MSPSKPIAVLTETGTISEKILKTLQGANSVATSNTAVVGIALQQIEELGFNRFTESLRKTYPAGGNGFVSVLHRLGVIYHARDDREKAEFLLQYALAAAESSKQDDEEVALVLNNLGRVLYDIGQVRQAEALYQRSLECLRKLFGPAHPKTATPMKNLANLYFDQGKAELAHRLYSESIAILESTLSSESPKLIKLRKKQALARLRIGEVGNDERHGRG